MRKEIKTGLFAVIVLAVALFMIEFLKGKDVFSRNNTYYIIYPSVEGLSVSTGVTVGGYAAGIISDIEYNRQTMNYTVSASISREFDIPKDSYIEVYSSDILGTRKLRVTAQTYSAPGNCGSGWGHHPSWPPPATPSAAAWRLTCCPPSQEVWIP